jgi:hypothetical protein
LTRWGWFLALWLAGVLAVVVVGAALKLLFRAIL